MCVCNWKTVTIVVDKQAASVWLASVAAQQTEFSRFFYAGSDLQEY